MAARERHEMLGAGGCDVPAPRTEVAASPAPRTAETPADLDDRLRVVLENTVDVIVQYSLDGRVLWASPSLTTTFGIDHEAIVGTRCRIDHPEDHHVSKSALLRALSEGRDVFEQRSRVACADGRIRWADGRVRIVRDDSGEVACLIAAVRDVTEQVELEAALSASEARYRLVAENSSDFVSLTTTDGIISWVSPSVTAVLGWAPEDLVGRVGVGFFHPDDLEEVLGNIEQINRGEPVYRRIRVRCKDGSYRWLAEHRRAVTDADGAIVGRVAGWRDVTVELEHEAALAALDARYRLLAENSTDVVLHTGPDGTITWVSPSVTPTLGWRPDELVGGRVPDLLHPDELESMRPMIREVLARGVTTGRMEARFATADGSWRWMSDGRRVLMEDGGVVGGIDSLRDVQTEHEMRDELARQAELDSLTGLPNRRQVLARLAAMLAHAPRAGTRMALLFLDLDELKALNDTHGHAVGDSVLVEVGRRIAAAVRADDLVGRFGGDEFVVLVSALSAPADADAVAAAIHDSVSAPIGVGAATMAVTVSIGLTMMEPGDGADDVLRRADKALYRAKALGRARTERDTGSAARGSSM